MTFNRIHLAPIVLALSATLLSLPASAETRTNAGGSVMQDSHSSTHSMSGSSSSGGMDMKAMMKDNNEMMSSMEMTGNPDVDFAMMMRAHHQGGLKMAEAELRDGKDPAMRKMAKAIIAAQKKEINQLNTYLKKKSPAAGNAHGHTH